MADVAASDTENMPSTAAKGRALSSGELKMMLGQCLKMASENKITASNTWGLPLIEHLDDLIKGENAGQHTNFQRASVTLDAGVKIYSYRVDSVHTELFKMLGGLGRASGPQDDAEGGELGDGGLENASPSKRKRRTGDLNPEATLEPFFDALNVKKFDLAFAVDPLFQKTSAQFDEGGAKGLLLNNLSVYRGCDLVFDSMDVPEAAADDPAPAAAAACVSLDGLKPQLQALAQLRGGERISPALDDILALLGAAPGEGASAEAEAFVARIAADGATPASTGPEDWMVGASAPGSPAEMQGMSGDGAVGAESGREEAGEVPAPYDVDDGDDFDGGADFGGYDDGYDNFTANDTFEGAASQGASAGGPSLSQAMNGSTDLNDDAIHWLISAGSSAATSYVTAAKGWAGASHWRYRAVHADGDEEVDQAVGGRKKKRVPGAARKRNDPLDFVALMAQGAAEPEFEMMPRGGARRGRGKPKAKPKAKTLLPEDYHYTAEALARYSLRPRSFLAIPGSGIGPGGGTGAAAGGAFGAQDGGFADFGGDGFGFDGHDDDYDHEGGDAYGGGWDTFGGDGGLERAGDVGDALQLVEAARKVEKVDVNYSRAAKQVDVRSLKELMWGGIQEVLERRKRSGSEREAPIEFGDVLATVPAANAAGRLEDLSVHLCFICVLHLANEHGLVVKGVPELDRLLVSNVPA